MRRAAAPWWRRPGLWIVLAVLAIFVGNIGFRRLVRRSFELRHLNHELARLDAEQKRLREQLDGSGKGFALERAARRELGYQRPGEIEYRFPPPSK